MLDRQRFGFHTVPPTVVQARRQKQYSSHLRKNKQAFQSPMLVKDGSPSTFDLSAAVTFHKPLLLETVNSTTTISNLNDKVALLESQLNEATARLHQSDLEVDALRQRVGRIHDVKSKEENNNTSSIIVFATALRDMVLYHEDSRSATTDELIHQDEKVCIVYPPHVAENGDIWTTVRRLYTTGEVKEFEALFFDNEAKQAAFSNFTFSI